MKRAKTPKARSVTQPPAGFGADYFRKFYFNPRTRVVTAAEMHNRAALIAAILKHAELPTRRILDAGCGVGLLKKPFAQVLPRAKYTGLEFSAYLCRRHGWIQGSVADYVAKQPFDLVVCYDVLQYLDDSDAARALDNLSALSRAAVYVSALTREDWRNNCDRSLSDGAVHLRSGDWYRRRLRKSFNYLGFGVWLRREVSAILWDLEQR
jgi:trans-aconitate methyltransferase